LLGIRLLAIRHLLLSRQIVQLLDLLQAVLPDVRPQLITFHSRLATAASIPIGGSDQPWGTAEKH
jgi:hypothetical protein